MARQAVSCHEGCPQEGLILMVDTHPPKPGNDEICGGLPQDKSIIVGPKISQAENGTNMPLLIQCLPEASLT